MNDNLNVERNKRLLMRLGNLNQKYKSNTVTSEDFTESGTSYSMNVVANNILGTKISSGMKVVDYKINMDGTLIIIGEGGDVVTEFNIGSGLNNDVYSIIGTSDGGYLVGGYYSTYSGQTANRIIKLKSDGTIDESFNSGSGFNASVSCIIETIDNEYLIGGGFTTYSGQTANGIIKLKSDGSVDTSLNVGSGFNNDVYSVIKISNSNYLVGGVFTTFSGQTVNRIVMLKSNGGIDTSFNFGTGFNNYVNALLQTTDGGYLIAGDFTTYSGQTANGIIKLKSDGTIDESFNSGTGFNGEVASLLQITDDEYLIGGSFTTYSGQTANHIVKLKSDGTIDESFNSGTGFNGPIISIVKTIDNKYLMGGIFTTYSGQTANRIIKLKSDGTIDESFNSGSGFNGPILNIIKTIDNAYLMGGGFTTYSGQTVNRIIKLKPNGENITISE